MDFRPDPATLRGGFSRGSVRRRSCRLCQVIYGSYSARSRHLIRRLSKYWLRIQNLLM
jgi:hypothetical protein